MRRSIRRPIFVLTAFASATLSLSASAALFDTIDSVETIQRVAAQQAKTDRMPASEKATAAEAEKAKTPATPEKSETAGAEKN
jgi:hypothetical protein